MDSTSALSTLETVATFLFDSFGSMAETLLSEPLFLISIGFFVLGGCIGLVHRILH